MKVLIIEDSALMRKYLRQILEQANFTVETARHGREGLDRLEDFNPDVITLDINMPVMDGLTCLSLIMQKRATPVVMVSSLTEKGAVSTFEALALGAVDYIAKPGGTVSLNIKEVQDELVQKIKLAARTKISRSLGLRDRMLAQRIENSDTKKFKPKIVTNSKSPSNPKNTHEIRLIMVGVSTGGPGTVEEIITSLPSDFPVPILIAQHMPARFTRVFAERLNKCCALNVMELGSRTRLEGGTVVIGKGDADIKVTSRGGMFYASTVPADKKFLWHPSVERMVRSAHDVCDPNSVLCIQLTGMGNDGAEAMSVMHNDGAITIAESEETAVVYGMPKELVARGGAQYVLANYKIADKIQRIVSENQRKDKSYGA